MPKALCVAGMVVAGLLLLLFGLDLSTAFLLESAFPFGGVSLAMDGGFVVSAGILGYLSWSTFREQV